MSTKGRSSGPLTDDVIELAVAEIQQVARIGTLQMALSIGQIVYRRIFRSNAELLHLNGPKDVSFRQLAARGDLGMSRTTLWRSVAAYELSLRMPQLGKAEHIGISHVRAVIGLPKRNQERLLARAERERLDVKQLEREVAATRKSGSGGGRPPKQDFVKAVDALMRVANLPDHWFADQRAAAKMKADDVECALAMLDELQAKLRRVREVLEERSRVTVSR